MQDTYLAAFKNLRQLTEPAKFHGWLERIAINKCKDILKKNKPIPVDDELLEETLSVEDELSLPEKYIIDKEKRQILLTIMRTHLTQLQYETVLLYYFNNFSVSEIAKIMECSEGAVMNRLSKARHNIKTAIDANQNGEKDKLFAFAGIPILTKLFAEELNALQAPKMPKELGTLISSSATTVPVTDATVATNSTASNTASANPNITTTGQTASAVTPTKTASVQATSVSTTSAPTASAPTKGAAARVGALAGKKIATILIVSTISLAAAGIAINAIYTKNNSSQSHMKEDNTNNVDFIKNSSDSKNDSSDNSGSKNDGSDNSDSKNDSADNSGSENNSTDSFDSKKGSTSSHKSEYTGTPAILGSGSFINSRFKSLAGNLENITAIRRSDTLPDNINFSDNQYNIASSGSELPIYTWYDNGILYYYADTQWIQTGKDMKSTFSNCTNLEDISGLASWDTSNTKDMGYLFHKNEHLKNIDALKDWNTENVTTMESMFYATALEDINALADWDVENVTRMVGMFSHAEQLKKNVDGAINWDVSNVTKMGCLFHEIPTLTNIDGLKNWDTSKVEDMSYIFSKSTCITDFSAIENWDISSVTNKQSAFTGIDKDILPSWYQ